MVDGVLASCYASADHDLGHIGLTPIRLFPGMVEMIFGNDERSPAYVSIIRSTKGVKNMLPFGSAIGLN